MLYFFVNFYLYNITEYIVNSVSNNITYNFACKIFICDNMWQTIILITESLSLMYIVCPNLNFKLYIMYIFGLYDFVDVLVLGENTVYIVQPSGHDTSQKMSKSQLSILFFIPVFLCTSHEHCFLHSVPRLNIFCNFSIIIDAILNRAV